MRSTLVASFLFSSFSLSLAQLTVPADLPGTWEDQGCWTDVAGRAIGAASYADPVAMTNQACLAFCETRGFLYAGTEYSVECFCGSSVAAAAIKVDSTQCNMACSGDTTQPCGAGGKLNLFKSLVIAGPQTNPGVNGFVYQGCYSEGTTGRALTFAPPGIVGSELTVAKCTSACKTAGYTLAGVEYGGECFCGQTITNGAVPATGCDMLCNGNSSEYCGAGNRLDVYSSGGLLTTSASNVLTTQTPTAVPTAVSTATISLSVGPAPTGPSQPATVGNYDLYGCQTEGTGARALVAATYASDEMTLESCRAFCSAYTYFGVEYARECYCGNSFSPGSVPAPATDCSLTCAGGAFEYCGAGNRLSVYARNGTPPPSSTTAATAEPTNTTPVVTDLPEGWTYRGCWVEGKTGRSLPHQLPDSTANTPGLCGSLCKAAGYSISGTEYGVQCFCGNALYNGAVKTTESQCSVSCPGDTTQKCGAGDRLSIVSDGEPQEYTPPAPQTGGLNGTWAYQGCLTSTVDEARVFWWQNFFPGTMTPSKCLGRCAEFGYAAAGLEYGEECYCGDPVNVAERGATFRPESECNIVCPGNASSICGGGGRLSTYFWTGETPLYEWTVPQDHRAGKYEFLINGVTIPLMTMETITGKVSFISKAGTGPGNETGAYELDLSLTDDFNAAWRTLHLKTDVFCAAGVILPDKAGRQLMVGGWSGDSTYGTRLYWPDGSPGVEGTRDWQENVDVLRLQAGRWYPSVMVMTNGSVMVIGGEVGSNAAATPSIEVLPYTGTKPLYREWLDRTDPNNLYPFVAILPSGGIFVAYWNEARIISQDTFDDIKLLPNAPGAVNDPKAGRTYPMEGASVLLPQRYPYTDPLGVLICGGSTIGVANALDNCVSIYPDAPNPEWKLERMPSFRVMPVMAALPDGTYFLGGGAHHGVAGFGLATGPNLNALLYDPTKPLHRRFTVADNTTIARLYHSEAITLLDGRVLVSGSNPEDGKNIEEYRVEVFLPPYLLSGLPRPTFSITNKDWAWGQTNIPFSLGAAARNGDITVTLLGAVSSTHGNAMGSRTLMPKVTCTGTSCQVDAPPDGFVCPPGWYQFFVLDGGIPAVGIYVRIGGDPGEIGNWPQGPDFTVPGI
ncbi:glyoxal oxidase-like protein [Lasiosphaeria hispida]|uniref:Glyoxal oxidase-like protein n=1 Tax=Lasiosphaeria hispida TaxID=260671 RepID=A0AAJ0H6T0_9PEZI|nr:glyoxal oxidase-like protein [Lasiosphaeria hispida]